MIKKILFLMVIGVFVITGCSFLVTDDAKDEMLDTLKDKGYVSKDLKHVGESRVYKGSFDATAVYDTYDVYMDNGKYYSFGFDRNLSGQPSECDYIIAVYDVEFKTNQTVSEYDETTGQYKNVIKDVYVTNTSNSKKYCYYKSSSFFGLIENRQIKEY